MSATRGKLWELYAAAGELGEDLPAAIELLTGAARPILQRWFEAEVLQATLATDAIIGAFASISAPGTAYVLLHHVMGTAGGARGIWGYVRGGMGGLADALENACRDLRVKVLREREVVSILTERGRVQGVALSDGKVFEAPLVASSVDAHWTFERMLDPQVLPASFREAVARIDYSSASAKINVALSALPNFTARPQRAWPRSTMVPSISRPPSTTSNEPTTTPSTGGPVPSPCWKSPCPPPSTNRSRRPANT